MGVGAGEAVRYFRKSKKSGEVTPGSSGTSNSNEVETLKKELESAKSDFEKLKGDLEKSKEDRVIMKQGDGGTSIFDAIGVISYILGIGSDRKTDSGINAGKLATVITMHVIGIIIVCCFLYGKFVKKSIVTCMITSHVGVIYFVRQWA